MSTVWRFLKVEQESSQSYFFSLWSVFLILLTYLILNLITPDKQNLKNSIFLSLKHTIPAVLKILSTETKEVVLTLVSVIFIPDILLKIFFDLKCQYFHTKSTRNQKLRKTFFPFLQYKARLVEVWLPNIR